MLTHGIVANRLALTGAIPAGDYLQWCNLDGKIKVRKVRNSFSPNSALMPAGGLALKPPIQTDKSDIMFSGSRHR